MKKKGTSQVLSSSYYPNHPVNHTPKVQCGHLGFENRAVIVIKNVSSWEKAARQYTTNPTWHYHGDNYVILQCFPQESVREQTNTQGNITANCDNHQQIQKIQQMPSIIQKKSIMKEMKAIYLPRIARVKTIASEPILIVLVLKPFPSENWPKGRDLIIDRHNNVWERRKKHWAARN